MSDEESSAEDLEEMEGYEEGENAKHEAKEDENVKYVANEEGAEEKKDIEGEEPRKDLERILSAEEKGGESPRAKAIKERSLKDLVDEVYHVIKGFLKVGEKEDPYEAVKRMEGVVTVILPGWFDWPISVESFREYSGLNVVRFENRDPDEIHKFLTHIYEETGQRAVVIGFSDGEKRLCSYLKKHGDGAIGLGVGIASDKNADRYAKKGKVFYINGRKDCLAIWEKAYHSETQATIFEVDGSHGGCMEDKRAVKQIADIIRNRASAKGAYTDYKPKKLQDGCLEMLGDFFFYASKDLVD